MDNEAQNNNAVNKAFDSARPQQRNGDIGTHSFHQQPQLYRSKYGSNKNFEKPTVQPVLPERILNYPGTNANASKDVLVPGAREHRQPIIQNITKHSRRQSQEAGPGGHIASQDQSVQMNSMGGVNSGRIDALQNSASVYSQVASNGTLGVAGSNAVLGLQNKDNMTFRGQLESLEQVLIDIVSEIKYHRRQVEIIGAEKDTSGAVLQMNIVKSKNESLNEEYKLAQEIKRENTDQEKAHVKIHRQIEVLHNDTYTANTRLLQMQRRITELEGAVGIQQAK